MKKVLLVGHDGEARLPYENSKAWSAFAKVLNDSGFEIVNEYSEDVYAIIANSNKHNFMSKEQFQKIDHTKRILILWEPYVVETERYQAEVLEQYAHIYAPSRIWADRVGGIAFNWPQEPIDNERRIFEHWEGRLKKVVVIQGNKFSARKGELYSLRRRVLSKVHPSKLDLYGTNWNTGIKFDWWHWSRSLVNSKFFDISLSSSFGIGGSYSNYLGTTENKMSTLENYQICLVIENSADFVSEKLFDSIRAGCITIYVGPNLDNFGLKPDVAINANATRKEVIKAIDAVFQLNTSARLDIAKYQRNALSLVSDEWENVEVLRMLALRILEDLFGVSKR